MEPARSAARGETRSDLAEAPTSVARLAFALAAIGFAAIALVTGRWISRASVGDGFWFGSTRLWSAMDPVGFYFADLLLFFRSGPVEIDLHPGLPMVLSGAILAEGMYALWSLAGTTEPYVEHWVRHRVFLNAMLAFLASAMLLACTHPLFRVLRHFMDRAAAYVGAALFLCSVPVLLYVSRFSPEGWMLYFTLWSIHFSLRALDGERGLRVAAAMGACAALGLLSKWLALPVVLLNVGSLLPRRGEGVRRSLRALAIWGASGGAVTALLFLKVSVPHLTGWLTRDVRNRGVDRLVFVWSLHHQRPFVVHHLLVFALGALGLAAIYRSRSVDRVKLGALLATLAAMMLVTARRPYWHYFFCFYWLFPAAAAYGMAQLIERRGGWRRDVAAVAGGLIVVAICNVWSYPGIAATYAHYRAVFAERATLAAEHPAWMPAPWETALDDFAQTRDPRRFAPRFGRRLDPFVRRQRLMENYVADLRRATPRAPGAAEP